MDPPPQYGHQGMPQNTYDMNAYTNAGYAASPQQVNVVVQQPTAAQKIYVEPKNYPLPRSWKSGLCGCFDDIGNCLLTACFGPCMLCVVSLVFKSLASDKRKFLINSSPHFLSRLL